MKQVININFQGRVVPIEVTAFDLLKNYTESLNRYFASEEGKEEIINDIESRIGELFQDRLKEGATCITDSDINAIIKSMGRPEDFEAEDVSGNGNSYSRDQAAESNTTFKSSGKPRRLFRDEHDKVIGGVCSGLANYFNLDVVVVRIIFVVLAVSFGVGLIPYLILWIAVPSSASTEIGSARKKLFRDGEDNIIAGVCSGIGNYFGINAWIPRVLFILPFLSFISRWGHWGGMFGFSDFVRLGFSPGALIVYVILWLVIPEASTTAEKLEMKGEKIDMNSIKNSVMEEMKGVQERAQKFGKEAGSVVGEKSKSFSSEADNLARRGSRSLGNIIALLFKIFVYFIFGCIAFTLVVALFALAVLSIGLFPMKDFILTEGWQSFFAWGTLIFFIATPIIGILTWLIRRLAKIRTNRKLMRVSFLSLWLLGVFCFISLIVSVARDFKSGNTLNEQEIALVNPVVNKLEITSASPDKKIYSNRWFKMEPFEGYDEDTVYVKNIAVHIIKSPNDSFRVTYLNMVRGRNRRSADTLADMMNFNAVQLDSLLLIDRGIAITRKDKFRNQRLVLTVYVPVGKQVRIDKSVGWGHDVHFDGPFNNNWDIEFDGIEHGWDNNTDYIMRENGLYTLDGKPADNWKQRKIKVGRGGIDIHDGNDRIRIDENGVDISTDEEGGYRYRDNMRSNRADSLRKLLEQEQKKVRDSLEKLKENIDKQLENVTFSSSQNNNILNYSLPAYNPLLIMD